MAKKYDRANDEHGRVAGMPEYDEAVHTHTDEPAMHAMGFSEWDYGDQRYGDGEQRHDGFAQPGEEGAVAIKEQLQLGAFGGHEREESIAANETVGDEPMPGDGHGGRGRQRKTKMSGVKEHGSDHSK